LRNVHAEVRQLLHQLVVHKYDIEHQCFFFRLK
jgi:hypothetical protein